ncbi:MAG TPA: undecaprenyldiphospho-muramoylpentapeptide beta-N-acetylglucosaminyltransferase [Candidatus Binataceae bacterium]|nr:undecaprenyldiphospho-muramoylpentapeptide beta-N-acetylglucosaminyltransferase [Candidatus Binataceae bacterium]
MKVIIAGGGTGGHLFPAVALGEELVRERPDTEVLYVGTSAGLEARWLPASGYRHELFDVHGIRGHGPIARLRSMGEFIRAVRLARSLLGRFRAQLVVAAGGYASAPMAVAAALARVPIVMMEQNAVPGLANRMLWRFARKVCVGFEDTGSYFDSPRVEVTGNPVRFKARPERTPLEGRPLQILVLGGSSGAHRLNLGVIRAFKIWGKSVINLRVVHQTGEGDEGLVQDAYRELPFRADVIPFIDNMAEQLQRADLVVARAGGMTVTDVALSARPAIFVPYPFHRDRQQELNALVLERLGGAIIVRDDDALGENLAREMKVLLDDPGRLAAMGERAHQAAHPDAAERIAHICFEAASAKDPRA